MRSHVDVTLTSGMLGSDQHVVCDLQQNAAEWNREIPPELSGV